ncbi:MAG: hypothetical protein HGB00_02210 [Chlorobiaceae bacterium]|nr:hypothetical protein [Chlorobiaceae bacterium]
MKLLLLLATTLILINTRADAASKNVQLASFDHGRLNASSSCIRCHNRDQPDDDRHRQAQANCSKCHTTESWKPATIDSDEDAK